MEFRVGSVPLRSNFSIHGSTVPDCHSESPLSGFLNRKCVIEPGGKKSKDRSWQTYWCQLNGVSLEFHKVDGVKSEGFRPPPRDIFPPPHMPYHKAGFVSVAGATAEDDYTSQIGKDLQKRRSWLFELTLPNEMVYLLQAPNGTQRAQWIQHIRKAASGKGDDMEGRKLKAARCSVRHRSRQNVLSLKSGQVVEAGEVSDVLTAVRGDPCANLLQEMLRTKKELLAQMNRMCSSFIGDTEELYTEEVKRTAVSVIEPVTSPRRLSFPTPGLSSIVPHQHNSRRASTGAFSTSTVHNSVPRIRTRLLKDHFLVPGAMWSQLREGEEVVLTGRLANGWFRCLAKRDVSATTGLGLDFFTVSSHLLSDGELPPTNRYSASSLPDPQLDVADTPSPTLDPTEDSTEATEGVTEMFVSGPATPEIPDGNTCSLLLHNQKSGSHDPAIGQSGQSVAPREASPSLVRVGRSYSYITATQTNPESSLLGPQNPRRSLDYTVTHKRIAEEMEESSQGMEERQGTTSALKNLLSHLTKTQSHSYRFPLVGVIPPSVVEKIPEMSDLILVAPPGVSHSVSTTAAATSPAHSFIQMDADYQSSEVHQQVNGHIAIPTHTQRPGSPTSSQIPTKKHVSSISAPTTPLHTPVQSPVPPPTASHVDMSPSKLPHSPSKSPRARRRTYEPVTGMFDNTFIKKFLPRKKPSKQISLPDKLSISKTPNIEEEVPYSQSPSPAPPSLPPSPLPAPSMLEFSEHEMQTDMRTRMSSVSGRPIKYTGICLQFGEDESSSDSEPESGAESDVHDRLALSKSLPPTRGFAGGSIHSSPTFASGLLVPPPVSPDIMAPGNLRRAASAHGSLHVRVEEPEVISRSKSGSTHSLTSAIFRGLRSSFKKYDYEDVPAPAKKRGSSKRMRQGSLCEAAEPELPKLGGIFRQPPTGQKRFVYLDPRQPKYGFRLESYGRPSEQGQDIQVFVQSVSPGSPAFMSGLYPGDKILEVNGVNVRSDPVAAVVKRIQECPRKSEKKVQLTVMFVDGVARLERMKKADHLRYQLKMKQAQLRVMISEASNNLAATALPPTQRITLASDLEPWSKQTPLAETPYLYPCDCVLNEQVALCSVHPSALASDVLVIPFCVDVNRQSENILTQLVMDGGPQLLDELCLAAYHPLGDHIVTKGYLLPAHCIYHCAIGHLEENLQQCIWHVLESGLANKTATIAFWLDGFTAVNVSPQRVIEYVRLWLQQGGKSSKYKRIIFSATTNPDLAKTLIERFFPLAHYYFSLTPGSDWRMPPDQEDHTLAPEEGKQIQDFTTVSEDPHIISPQPTLPQEDTLETTEQVFPSSLSSRTLNAQRLESDV